MSLSIYKSSQGRELIMRLYDEALARWPVPFEPLTLDTRHGRTFAIASGDRSAPPVMLLHGSCSNAVSWAGDVKPLADSFRVYALDMPGEPGRSDENRPSWKTPAFAEWLDDVLDALGIAQASVVGISQGGWTALRFATWRPERVAKLVLLAPGGIVPVRTSFLIYAVAMLMFGRRGAQAVNRRVIGGLPIHPEALQFMDAVMTHFRPRIESQTMFRDDELKRLSMPVLLMLGARDTLFPSDKVAARLSRLASDLRVMILPDAGHVLNGRVAKGLPFLSQGLEAVK